MFGDISTLMEATLEMRIWCFLLVIFIISVSWSVNYNYSPNKPVSVLQGGRTAVLFFSFFILALTWWVDGDYFSYIQYASQFDVNWQFEENALIEKGHQAICSLVNGDWLGYRIICWGGALTLFVVTAKRFGINIQHSLFCLFILWHHTFCYGRVTLAMAIYFFGVSFLCRPLNKRVISYIIGVLIILCCSYFHRSAILLIATTPALWVLFVKKRLNISFLILYVILVFVIIYLNIGLLYNSSDLDESITNKLESYSNRQIAEKTIFGVISQYISYVAKYIPIIVITYIIIRVRNIVLPRFIKMLYGLMMTLFIISLTFYFTGEAQFTLFYRTLNFVMIPSSLILAFLHINGFMSKKMFLYAIALGLFQSVWKVFYSIYSA